MADLEAFDLHASSWQFLSDPGAYVAASAGSTRPLLEHSTGRQLVTAKEILERLNGGHGQPPRKGILLADDVGLGKTTVAAIVAWVVAGQDRSVRILAPNAPMRRRWVEELRAHVPLLRKCAAHLDANSKRVKGDAAVLRLAGGSIQVATHRYADGDNTLRCDLLIVDEAHRAKGDETQFSQALRAQSRHARRVLILTATPLSIDPAELQRMMELIGAQETGTAIRSYSRALCKFYEQSPSASKEATAKKLSDKAKAAIEALWPFVIRHGVSDLTREQSSFGEQVTWGLPVPSASTTDLELLLRMDRAMRIVRDAREGSREQTNDARYHVGWEHLRRDARELHAWLKAASRTTATATAGKQLVRIEELAETLGVHPKMNAVADAVHAIVEEGEKVLLFCFHHATAQELAKVLLQRLQRLPKESRATEAQWRSAWLNVLADEADEEHSHSDLRQLRDTFVRWLSSRGLRLQVESWIDRGLDLGKPTILARALEQTSARGHGVSIARAAQELFAHLTEGGSLSTLGVLRAAKDRAEPLYGADGLRVVAVCAAPDGSIDHAGFIGSQQPDTLIAIFNSPFGPDALVSTDRLSEGIDLHRYCRHLIHYEMSASPIRTIQRNGRLRRVNSWAAVTRRPFHVAYPAFGGTRDHRLVSIMKRRVDAFSMLLGGVPEFELDANEEDELWRSEVVKLMRKNLEPLNGLLAVAR